MPPRGPTTAPKPTRAAPHDHRFFQSDACTGRGRAAAGRPVVRVGASCVRGLADLLPGQLACVRDGVFAVRGGQDRRRGQLCRGQLGAAFRHRAGDRHLQCARAVAGDRGRSRDRAVCSKEHRLGNRHRARVSGLCLDAAVPGGSDRHHGHRRCLQPVRVPGDFLAVVLCADRDGAQASCSAVLVPVSDHGHGGRHVPADRYRADLHDDGHAQHG